MVLLFKVSSTVSFHLFPARTPPATGDISSQTSLANAHLWDFVGKTGQEG